MKMRWLLSVFLVTVLLVLTASLFLQSPIGNNVSAQQTAPEVAPSGGGKFESEPSDSMTDAQRRKIQSTIQQNITKLTNESRLAPASPDIVTFSWPLRKAAGQPDFDIDGISNYVDQNPAYPDHLLDWNCGARTYDQASGYNHAGTDIFTWPFSWKKVDDNSVEIIAAAAGTIVSKTDGNFDRNCSFNNLTPNAVYVRHADNSVAWYLHMKSGSLTSKVVGDTVVAGEKLGIVGSSGSSTGPHLHFEIYNAANQLQDPFQGTCNTINSFTYWTSQQPYRVSRVNNLMTESAPPVFPACPMTETTNEKTVFQPGENIYTTVFYRDLLPNQTAQYFLLQPDGSTYLSWTHTNDNTTYSAAYFYWYYPLPQNGPNGTWTFRGVFNGNTYNRTFVVGAASASVNGRVLTADGRGLRNATVSITDSLGVSRNATTSSFGFFSFDNVSTGGTYTFRIASRFFRFTPRTVQVNDNLTLADFTGLE